MADETKKPAPGEPRRTDHVRTREEIREELERELLAGVTPSDREADRRALLDAASRSTDPEDMRKASRVIGVEARDVTLEVDGKPVPVVAATVTIPTQPVAVVGVSDGAGGVLGGPETPWGPMGAFGPSLLAPRILRNVLEAAVRAATDVRHEADFLAAMRAAISSGFLPPLCELANGTRVILSEEHNAAERRTAKPLPVRTKLAQSVIDRALAQYRQARADLADVEAKLADAETRATLAGDELEASGEQIPALCRRIGLLEQIADRAIAGAGWGKYGHASFFSAPLSTYSANDLERMIQGLPLVPDASEARAIDRDRAGAYRSICEALGFCETANGQSGAELMPASTVIEDVRALRSRNSLLEGADDTAGKALEVLGKIEAAARDDLDEDEAVEKWNNAGDDEIEAFGEEFADFIASIRDSGSEAAAFREALAWAAGHLTAPRVGAVVQSCNDARAKLSDACEDGPALASWLEEFRHACRGALEERIRLADAAAPTPGVVIGHPEVADPGSVSEEERWKGIARAAERVAGNRRLELARAIGAAESTPWGDLLKWASEARTFRDDLASTFGSFPSWDACFTRVAGLRNERNALAKQLEKMVLAEAVPKTGGKRAALQKALGDEGEPIPFGDMLERVRHLVRGEALDRAHLADVSVAMGLQGTISWDLAIETAKGLCDFRERVAKAAGVHDGAARSAILGAVSRLRSDLEESRAKGRTLEQTTKQTQAELARLTRERDGLSRQLNEIAPVERAGGIASNRRSGGFVATRTARDMLRTLAAFLLTKEAATALDAAATALEANPEDEAAGATFQGLVEAAIHAVAQSAQTSEQHARARGQLETRITEIRASYTGELAARRTLELAIEDLHRIADASAMKQGVDLTKTVPAVGDLVSQRLARLAWFVGTASVAPLIELEERTIREKLAEIADDIVVRLTDALEGLR